MWYNFKVQLSSRDMSKKVLIIDDEFKFVDALAEGLTILGYEVYKAGTGQRGIEIIERLNPEIVICDYKLPDMDGDFLLKKGQETSPQAKFIMVTAYYDEELNGRFRRAGAKEVIYKPITLEGLEELLIKL